MNKIRVIIDDKREHQPSSRHPIQLNRINVFTSSPKATFSNLSPEKVKPSFIVWDSSFILCKFSKKSPTFFLALDDFMQIR